MGGFPTNDLVEFPPKKATPTERDEFPEMITLCFHFRCNLRCNFCCYWGDKQTESETLKFPDQRLPLEKALELVDEIGKREDSPFLLLGGASGEPTLYPHFVEVARHAKSLGIHLSVTTNGTMLHRMIDDLIDMEFDEVRVSINTLDREHYKKVTRVDSLERVNNNVMNLIEARGDKLFPRIGAMMVYTEENEYEVDDFVDFWKDKADYVRVTPAIIDKDYEREDIMKEEERVPSPCKVGLNAMNILSTGDVTFCVRTETRVGNLFKDGGIVLSRRVRTWCVTISAAARESSSPASL